jgi:hypothetical protein
MSELDKSVAAAEPNVDGGGESAAGAEPNVDGGGESAAGVEGDVQGRGVRPSPLSSTVVRLAADAAASWRTKADVATKNQRDYQAKLEHAQPEKVFRYVFLINNAAVEKYVSQSRAQAEASFLLSRRASIAGFALLLVSVVIGLVSQRTDHPLDIAYISAVAGAITQFLSGVFFGSTTELSSRLTSSTRGSCRSRQKLWMQSVESPRQPERRKWAVLMRKASSRRCRSRKRSLQSVEQSLATTRPPMP